MEDNSNISLKLASAAEDVKIWHATDYSLFRRLPTKSVSSFRNVHWSWDFQQLVCVPAQARRIMLYLVADKLVQMEHHFEEEPVVAQFSNTCRFVLGVGTNTGRVSLWDAKNQKVMKSFHTDKSAITCLQFNSNDSHIASGSSNGTISLHNCLIGQSSKPFGNPVAHAIRSLQYSYLKRALIGTASDDGSITLWDANTEQALFSSPAFHMAPATAVRFSSTNSLLMVSCGLDQKIGCFDINSRKAIKSIDSGVPITSADFKEDGFTLAVGSSGGKILIYDLRSLSQPLDAISAHTSSVQCLAFQNAIQGASARTKMLKKSSKSEMSRVYYRDGKAEISGESCIGSSEQCSEFPIEGSLIGRYSVSSDIFSPLRETVGGEASAVALEAKCPSGIAVYDSAVKARSFHKDSSVFSPMNNLGQLGDVYGSFSDGSPALLQRPVSRGKRSPLVPSEAVSPSIPEVPKENVCSVENGKLDQPEFPPDILNLKSLSPQIENKPTVWPSDKPANSVHCISCLNLKGMCSSNNGKFKRQADSSLRSETASDFGDAPCNAAQTVTVTPPSSEIERSPTLDAPEAENCFRLGLSQVSGGDSVDEGRGTGAQTTPMTPQSFQAEYIRQCVVDVMEDHMDEMRKFIHMEHVLMCRQFHLQEEKIESLFSKYAIDSDLVSEVANLKKQNRVLRDMFR